MKRNYENEKSYIFIFQIPISEIKKVLENYKIDRYMILNNQLGVIYESSDFDPEILTQIPEIVFWQDANPMSSLIKITDDIKNGINIESASGIGNFKSPYINLTGKGLLVAIIDSGVNYLHPDFINEDGTSKILSIWNQESDIKQNTEEVVFGDEFTREDINQAIKENNPNLCIDEVGTGTMAAGIICGNGNVESKYKGIAPNVELIVVKLRKYENTYHKGKINYLSSDFLAAISYVLKIKKREDKPLIVNLTVGERSSAIYKLSPLNTFTELYQSGVVVVSGAGNEGNTDIHYSGSFNKTMKGQNDIYQDIILQEYEDNNMDIFISSLGNDKISAVVISPSGELSMTAEYAPDNMIYRGRFNLENTSYSIKYILPWILSNSLAVKISLKDIKPGIWTIRLIPEYILNGNYNVYLPNKNLISINTRFIDADSSYTITTYGLLKELITVGVYNEKINSMWLGSSKGPHAENSIKPDIVASGVDIISTYINNDYRTGTGSGISSSIVCGALSLIMEYIIYQTDIPQYSLYNEPLKTYLMIGASQKEIYKYPNVSEGYGLLNFENTIKRISDNLI